MSTKYAKARDVAFQWRAEHRKVRQENRSLRKVYETAKALSHAIASGGEFDSELDALRDSLAGAVFAVEQP